MTQTLASAMQHAEWKAKKILKKHYQNRPLAPIEDYHHFVAPQPVLSSNTVDIDCWGTRIYKAKTSADILDEQHRIIHEVYTRARSLPVTPSPLQDKTPRSRLSSARSTQSNTRVLRSLHLEGQPMNRPFTSKSEPSFVYLQPKSAANNRHTRIQSAIDDHGDLIFLKDATSTNKGLNNTNQRIKNSWKAENRNLNYGKYVRGRPGGPSVASSLDSKSGHSWMSFGGGIKENSAGLIDAFTEVSPEMNFVMDGDTGVTLTKQLQKGDKLRVCRNGLPVNQSNSGVTGPRSGKVYFTVDELINEGTVRIITPSPSPQNRPTHRTEIQMPTFHKLGEMIIFSENTDSTRPKSTQGGKYSVMRRNTARKNIDGSRNRPSGIVTHIEIQKGKGVPEPIDSTHRYHSNSIAPIGTEESTTADQVNHPENEFKPENPKVMDDTINEDVLNIVHNDAVIPSPPNSIDGSVLLNAVQRTSSGYAGKSHTNRGAGNQGGIRQSNIRRPLSSNTTDRRPMTRQASQTHDVRPKSGHGSDRLQRSSASIPSVCFDGDLVTDNKAAAVQPRAKSAGNPFKHQQRNLGRPPPIKPSLHKGAGAAGAIIKGNNEGGGDNKEFIQIHRQLCVTLEHMKLDTASGTGQTSRQKTEAAVQLVSKHNVPDQSDQHNVPDQSDRGKQAEDARSDTSELSSLHMNSARLSVTGSLSSEEDNESAPAEAKYAFQIPTADNEAIGTPRE